MALLSAPHAVCSVPLREELGLDSRSTGLGWGSPASLPDQSDEPVAQPGQVES